MSYPYPEGVPSFRLNTTAELAALLRGFAKSQRLYGEEIGAPHPDALQHFEDAAMADAAAQRLEDLDRTARETQADATRYYAALRDLERRTAAQEKATP